MPKPAGVVAAGAVGGGGVTVGGGYAVHAMTVVTIEEQLKIEKFEDKGIEDTSAWTSMKTRVEEAKKKHDDLKNLDTTNSGDAIKSWCLSKKSETYGSQIKPDNKALLEKVKEFCYLSIKDKLGSNAFSVSDNSKDSEFTTKSTTLKSHSGEPNLDTLENKRVNGESLGEIKNSATRDKLKEWCKEAYGLPYLGEKDPEYKLANKFCTNNSSE